MNRFPVALVAAMLSLVPAITAASEFRSYHVGNSLTWNLLNSGKFTALSAGTERQHTAGVHIKASAPLSYIAGNPGDYNGFWIAPFDAALSDYRWDAVALQPYITSFSPIPSDLASDARVISDMISLARTNPENSTTQFYIYATWPAQDLGSYEDVWTRAATSSPSQATMLARAYFEVLYGAVTAEHPGVRMIPAGEALFAVDQRIRQGTLPGLSSIADLYADTYHLNDLGSHVVAAAAYATMFGETPVGLPYASSDVPVSADTLRGLQETVWGVVTSHSYTGVPEPTSLTALLAGSLLLLRRTRTSA